VFINYRATYQEFYNQTTAVAKALFLGAKAETESESGLPTAMNGFFYNMQQPESVYW
jgi:hypothetical protein